MMNDLINRNRVSKKPSNGTDSSIRFRIGDRSGHLLESGRDRRERQIEVSYQPAERRETPSLHLLTGQMPRPGSAFRKYFRLQ
jgi:hypothetical protein